MGPLSLIRLLLEEMKASVELLKNVAVVSERPQLYPPLTPIYQPVQSYTGTTTGRAFTGMSAASTGCATKTKVSAPIPAARIFFIWPPKSRTLSGAECASDPSHLTSSRSRPSADNERLLDVKSCQAEPPRCGIIYSMAANFKPLKLQCLMGLLPANDTRAKSSAARSLAGAQSCAIAIAA